MIHQLNIIKTTKKDYKKKKDYERYQSSSKEDKKAAMWA